jgi:hypothetical protein
VLPVRHKAGRTQSNLWRKEPLPADPDIDARFREAVRAIDAGDVATLASMLAANPSLVRIGWSSPAPG